MDPLEDVADADAPFTRDPRRGEPPDRRGGRGPVVGLGRGPSHAPLHAPRSSWRPWATTSIAHDPIGEREGNQSNGDGDCADMPVVKLVGVETGQKTMQRLGGLNMEPRQDCQRD